MKPKYQVGDLVKEVGHPDSKSGKVLSILQDERGYTYKLEAREVDVQNAEIIHGVKTCHEDELEKVKEEEGVESE